MRLSTLFASAAFVASSLIAASAAAHPGPIFGSNFVLDDFNHIFLKPDPKAYWWVANTGTLDGNYNVYYDYCGDATCVLQKRRGFTTYASLELYPGGMSNSYYCSELADVQTGFAYGTQMKWGPKVHHPVVMFTRFRFSDNYLIDGSGGAVGSAGVWLWNSPVDYITGESHLANAVGISWVTNKSVLTPGLNVIVYESSWPTFSAAPTDPINLQEWNTYLSVWSVDPDGAQSISYWINDEFLGQAPIASNFDPLSIEIWNDNQHPEWEGIVLEDATESQAMDLDSFSIFKL